MVIKPGKIYRDFSLLDYNTFGIDCIAHAFVIVEHIDQLHSALEVADKPAYLIGGGSNMILPDHLDRFVILNRIGGFDVIDETERHVILELGGGANWHDSVVRCIDAGYGGIENLSLIPGTVGAAPIQNIGAYGVELTNVFDSLDAMHIDTGEMRRFDHRECNFGYRDSIFKHELKGVYIITHVRLRLTKANHAINTSYGAIQQELSLQGIEQPGIQDVSEVVIRIRQSKLPDPSVIGNCGSFFKNPVIRHDQWLELTQQFEDLKYYGVGNDQYKIPAGWMIDQCGLKGRRMGNVGCYEKQALVLVNLGGATSADVMAFAQLVEDRVYERYGIRLEREVNLVV